MSNPKELRKQIRNVVQEVFSDQVKTELFKELAKQINEENAKRWLQVDQHVKDFLKMIDDRAKSVQSLIMREVAAGLAENQTKTPPANKAPSAE